MPLKRLQGATVPLTREALSRWQVAVRGRKLLELESREVRRLLPDVFGRHVLQIGSWGSNGELLSGAETLHRAVLGTVKDRDAGAFIDPEKLPLPDKSIDAVLLPHTLEFAASPHNVLREVNRVLNDRGRLFLLGFNPWSGWSLQRWFGLQRAYPAAAHLYGARRVCDWLELLDFEIEQVRRYGAGFPWLGPHNAGEAWSLASLLQVFAEAYLVVAKKRVVPMNFVGKLHRAQLKPLVGVPVALPGARNQTRFESNES